MCPKRAPPGWAWQPAAACRRARRSTLTPRDCPCCAVSGAVSGSPWWDRAAGRRCRSTSCSQPAPLRHAPPKSRRSRWVRLGRDASGARFAWPARRLACSHLRMHVHRRNRRVDRRGCCCSSLLSRQLQPKLECTAGQFGHAPTSADLPPCPAPDTARVALQLQPRRTSCSPKAQLQPKSAAALCCC